MYHEYNQDELRSFCKKNIETLEVWSRRLIHEKMTEAYGIDYINVKVNNEPLVKKDIRKHIESMMQKEPERFKREVDTLFLDHIIYFLCNPKWYDKLFKQALDYAYPQGKDEAREFLNRLIPIRNPLSHSNPISIRQVEQAICYSHDFIDGLKRYYIDMGEEQMWNVPRIIKISDSVGNQFENAKDQRYGGSNFTVKQPLRCGDSYSVEVEVDSSFQASDYSLIWSTNLKHISEFDNKYRFSITFAEKNVGEGFGISCKVISTKSWHKYGSYDGEISIRITVLPPV